jgi:hypothetical protein
MEADRTPATQAGNSSIYAIEEGVCRLVQSTNDAVVAALSHPGDDHHARTHRLILVVREFAHALLDQRARGVSLSEETTGALRSLDQYNAFFTPRVVA